MCRTRPDSIQLYLGYGHSTGTEQTEASWLLYLYDCSTNMLALTEQAGASLRANG